MISFSPRTGCSGNSLRPMEFGLPVTARPSLQDVRGTNAAQKGFGITEQIYCIWGCDDLLPGILCCKTLST